MNAQKRSDLVRFTTKGQVVIPMWLRRQFCIENGTRAIVSATHEGILLKPVTSATIERGYGLLTRKSPSPGATAPATKSNYETQAGAR